MLTRELFITGYVQGVYYRKSALREARRLGLTGYIENRSDGSVYAEVQGNRAAMQAFVDWCRIGPEEADVDSVMTVDKEAAPYEQFKIRQ